jgi:hypothetical protein
VARKTTRKIIQPPLLFLHARPSSSFASKAMAKQLVRLLCKFIILFSSAFFFFLLSRVLVGSGDIDDFF